MLAEKLANNKARFQMLEKYKIKLNKFLEHIDPYSQATIQEVM